MHGRLTVECSFAFENEKLFFEKMEKYRGYEDMKWMPKYYGSGLLKEEASSCDSGDLWYVGVMFSAGGVGSLILVWLNIEFGHLHSHNEE